jgi:lysophospholipase L1-like esterase
MRLNLDRILPVLAPVMGVVLQRQKAVRRKMFEELPLAPGRVVFLGDSITHWCQWEDWFADLPTSNRGISGDTVGEVLTRLDTAIAEPAAVSIMIGTNDLTGFGRSTNPAEIARQTAELLGRIRQMAPSAPLLLNSVLPRSAYFASRIRELNEHYEDVAQQSGAIWVDLWPTMAADDGSLPGRFTPDGIHLNNVGYRAWVAVLDPQLRATLGRATRPSG